MHQKIESVHSKAAELRRPSLCKIRWDNSFIHILGVMNDLITISFYVIYDSNLSTGILILSISQNTQEQVCALGVLVAQWILFYFSLWIGHQDCVYVTPMQLWLCNVCQSEPVPELCATVSGLAQLCSHKGSISPVCCVPPSVISRAILTSTCLFNNRWKWRWRGG